MYKRPHHQRIEKLLHALNGDLLEQSACFFAGGTAIVLLLDEYRESVDVDLICASSEGYRALRTVAWDKGVSGFFITPVNPVRELRADRYGIRTFIEVDGVPIKFEIVHEDRIPLSGSKSPAWGIPVLSREDMYTEKLLANADRHADPSTASRDIIDLAMMISKWGPIPDSAWQKARSAYGPSVDKAFDKARQVLMQPGTLAVILGKLRMDPALSEPIRRAL